MYSMLFHSLFPKERFFKHMVSGTSLLRKSQINTNTNTLANLLLKLISIVIKININTNTQVYLCILCYSIACFQKRDFLNIWFLELAFLEKTQINTNTNTLTNLFNFGT